ncbi:DUF1016 N-terminal domain-containing protein [Desulfonatronovibrio magnus]|uniref:DUF1016 N-terminal domain-containing protein n=1 Tax=Desulfonatronovibrio magnus TaxID=698827 RepID=UPI0018DD664B|nr:DUF1016 N-terminal domain-containing protein [Desulfonatronovibrio magnus]
MSTDIQEKNNDSLFSRVVTILENARSNVVRSVNSNMVAAYWLIGREIVQELQKGEERAEYGKQVIEDLSDVSQHNMEKAFRQPIFGISGSFIRNILTVFQFSTRRVENV